MEDRIRNVFEAQQQHKLLLRKGDAETRIQKLRILKRGITSFEEELYAALQEDLRKCRFETAVTEIYFTYAEIDFAIKQLESWMKPVTVSPNISNLFAGNKIYYDPKGVCLIIAPWNYPFQLLMSPLISAIAAGNTAILKPSELSGATAAVISKMIAALFPPGEIACFEGDAELSSTLLALPFDHIFFTGSTAVGKIVMAAAAKHLSSVTLELGGKSPVVIDASADLSKAAEKIAWGKLINAGQTCIAPDYVLIDETLETKFIGFYKAACERMFFRNGKIDTAVYAKIITLKHFNRLKGLLNNAVNDGATLSWGGEQDESTLTFLPAVLTNVKNTQAIMQEEIFGPLLPIIPFKDPGEAIAFINARDKPLALYVFSGNKTSVEKIIRETGSGGVCVNDVLVHISNPNLPFGGVNKSGMGSCHGFFGFKTFSHERAVVFQSKLGLTKMIYPPYDKKRRLLKWLKRLM